MKYFFPIISTLVLLAIVAWFLLTFVLISDKERILKTLEKGRLAVESGSILALSNILAADYVDSSGMDKAMVLRVLQDLFQKTENRQIQFVETSVKVEDNHAEAKVEYVFHTEGTVSDARLNKFLHNKKPQAQTIDVSFIKDGRRWLIVRTAHNIAPSF